MNELSECGSIQKVFSSCGGVKESYYFLKQILAFCFRDAVC